MSVTAFPNDMSGQRERGWTLTTPGPLGESIRELALMLRAPRTPAGTDRTLRDQLRALLAPVREAFAAHRAATEGSTGIYAEMVLDAPRLARTVDGLVAEHDAIDAAMDTLAHWIEEVSGDIEALRRRALAVLDEIARHGQHDADLVHAAYTTDLGGE
ncbi:MAG: hemerythrin domain-containing protein [Micromonosporaceae bacterium]